MCQIYSFVSNNIGSLNSSQLKSGIDKRLHWNQILGNHEYRLKSRLCSEKILHIYWPRTLYIYFQWPRFLCFLKKKDQFSTNPLSKSSDKASTSCSNTRYDWQCHDLQTAVSDLVRGPKEYWLINCVIRRRFIAMANAMPTMPTIRCMVWQIRGDGLDLIKPIETKLSFLPDKKVIFVGKHHLVPAAEYGECMRHLG